MSDENETQCLDGKEMVNKEMQKNSQCTVTTGGMKLEPN